MPRWVRWLQPLLSGVFTVDNLDYVRRDAYLTGVAVGTGRRRAAAALRVHSERGLTLYEPGVGALEMFLTARPFMYQQVYFHRTVRAIDLDLAEVFGPSIRAIFGDGSPAERLAAYADLDEYALLHQAARWARGEDRVRRRGPAPGDGRVPGEVARRLAGDPAAPAALAGRGRDPRRVRGGRTAGRADRVARRTEPGRVAIDLAVVDARPADAGDAIRCWRSRRATAARRRWRRRSAGSRRTRSSAGGTGGLSRARASAPGRGRADGDLRIGRRRQGAGTASGDGFGVLRRAAAGRAAGRSGRSAPPAASSA